MFVDRAQTPQAFGLCHGDLVPRNLITRATGQLVLVDWGSASFGPTPLTDMVELLLQAQGTDEPNRPELEAFAEAAGIDLQAQQSTLHAARMLRLVDVVRWALDRRSDRMGDAVTNLRAAL